MNYFQRRRIRKNAGELLHHARHVRHMREDIAPRDSLDGLVQAAQSVESALHHDTLESLPEAMDKLGEAIHSLTPPRLHPGMRENLEILVVAVAIAMAFRTYFIQPFKIPTGSMQPTLYGIHYERCEKPDLLDRMPLKPITWLFSGRWYCEYRARATGPLHGPFPNPANPAEDLYEIGGVTHHLPHDRNVPLTVRANTVVYRGQLLASGIRITGDHLFVDKVRWNIRNPHRGEVMVFKTDGINIIGRVKTHYIKRMIGLPGDTIRILPPKVIIDGKPICKFSSIERIMSMELGYAGYQVTGDPDGYLGLPSHERKVGPTEYVAMGDNTGNSFDSRYWGPVPESNLVGPAVLVYWPISRRFGRIH